MFLVLFAIVLLLLFRVCNGRYGYWKKRGVKCERPVLIFGNFLRSVLQMENYFDMLERLHRRFRHERYYGMYKFFTPVLVLRDPELVRQICINDFDTFPDHQCLSDDNNDLLWKRNLFSLTGDEWKSVRTSITPCFTSSKLKAMFELVKQCSTNLVSHFNTKAAADVIQFEAKDVFTRYSHDVIATCAFGMNCDSLKDPDNELYLKALEASDFSGWKILKLLWPSMRKLLHLKIFSDDVAKFYKDLITRSVELRKRLGVVKPDLIHWMLENDSVDDMAALGLMFLITGFQTPSTLMAFIAYELAVNLEVQRRLAAEVDEVRKKNAGLLSTEDLAGMKYMGLVIQEVLRKWPSGPYTDRVCCQDYTIKGKGPGDEDLLVQKGTVVWIPLRSIHCDPDVFEDPERFLPERFEGGNVKTGAMLGFGIGPRACIGARFAMMEMKSVFFHLLSEFEIVAVDRTKIPMVLSKKDVTPVCQGGMWLGLKRRV